MPEIVKGDGTREPFRIEKLVSSMERSGAESHLAEKVAQKVGKGVKDGMSTSTIYKKAYELLRKEEGVTAARYSMRRAILDLGPTGFPFEDFVSVLMQARGYKTKTRVVIPGKCAAHEVDVVMEKGDSVIGAELKFHNTAGFKTDLKTALYVKARFDDIEAGWRERHSDTHVHEGWLITNTKFTSNTIDFAACAGLTLLGWSYPREEPLEKLIQETGVYPVTVLTNLSQAEKARLLESGVTMCKSIADNPEALLKAGIARKKHDAVVAESAALCKA